MADPLVIIVERPYVSEEEFLDAEAWTITSRSMLLVDAGPVPEGTALHCELRLGNGETLIVAEGIAVKHLTATPTRPAGLVMRYRRMSATSSEFMKRAVERAAGSRSGASLTLIPHSAAPTPTLSPHPMTATAGRQVAATEAAKTSSVPPLRRSTSGPPPRLDAASSQSSRGTSGRPSRQDMSDLPGRRETSGPPTRREAACPSPVCRQESIQDLPAVRSSKATKASSVAPGSTSRHTSQPPATVRSASVVPPARRISNAPTQQAQPASANAAPHRGNRDSGAMRRLRSRATAKEISTPPDREAVLSRLKRKKPGH
jgi:hypothetical protein